MVNQLLLDLLDTELTEVQQQKIEEYLFNILVKERLDIERSGVEHIVLAEIKVLFLKQKIDMLKIKLG